MIGLSVSLCIKDIIEGKARLKDVEKIIGRTAAVTPADWNGVIEEYREYFWDADPERGEQILRELLQAGKIEQPYLTSCQVPSLFAGDGTPKRWWVDTEAEITWKIP